MAHVQPPTTGPLSAPPTGWTPELTARFRGAVGVVILPTLNEEEGLAHTLAELRRQRLHAPERRVEILIIDGGSTDRTLEVARAAGVPAVRQSGRGKGAAVLETMHWVHANSIPFAVVLDADATYPPDRVLDALDLLEQSADLVVGVRRPVSGPAISFREATHRLGNIGLSYAASLLSRQTIFDLCSGFWGVSTQRFIELGVEQSFFAIEAEMVLKAVRQGLRVVQIPVEYRERVGIAKLHAVRDGSRILLAILKHGRPPIARSQPVNSEIPGPAELLSIGLITGSRAAVLECHPADSAVAARLATVLRRNFPETVVQMDPGPAVPSRVPAPVEDEGPTPMVISLSTAGAPSPGARAVAVSIGSHRRQLTVELPSVDAHMTSTKVLPPIGSARSGAWKSSEHSARNARFPSLEVLTSRLSYDPIDQQRAMLSANGFRVVEKARPVGHGSPAPLGEA
ncbi:MAG: glycosyltransferase family 2 protein [Thermoplasmata archaeon]|nr:glycosyltransferase family 2 protein [Thermoplasmata archaeon]